MTGDLEGRLGIRAWDFGFGTNIEDLGGKGLNHGD